MSWTSKYINPEGKPTVIIINSFLIAAFASVKSINKALVFGFGFADGIMPILYISIAVLLCLFGIYGHRYNHRPNAKNVMIASYVLAFYILTSQFIGPPLTSLSFVLCLVIFAMFIPSIFAIDVRAFIIGLMTISSFSVLRMKQIFVLTSDWGNSVDMDVSYAFLVPIIANIVYVIHYYKNDNGMGKTLTLVVSFINSFFLIELFFHGSRGPLLCIATLFLIFFIVEKKNVTYGVQVRGKRVFMGLFLTILLTTMLIPIMGVIEGLLSSHGISSYAISKFINLSNEGDVSNGREFLNALTIQGILERPIFGWGFDRFDANTGLLYPHNFLLQIFYDGGVLYFCVLIIPIIVSIYNKIKVCTLDQYLLILVLFASCVPGAFLSHNLYMNGGLWLFFGAMLTDNFIYQNNN